MDNVTNVGAFIEGEVKAQELVFELASKIVGASIPNHPITGDTQLNEWSEVFSSEGDKWVTYNEERRTTIAKYRHTNGNDYPIFKVTPPSTVTIDIDNNMEVRYYTSTTAFNLVDLIPLTITYDDGGTPKEVDLIGKLITFIPLGGVMTGYYVEQYRTLPNGNEEFDSNWNEFKLVTELPSVWNTYFVGGKVEFYSHGHTGYRDPLKSTITTQYTFSEKYYTANTTHIALPSVLLETTPSVNVGATAVPVNVLLEQPPSDFNHILISYGLGASATPSTGDPSTTYVGACDESTVKYGNVPVITSQTKAREIYEQWNSGGAQSFSPFKISFGLDIDGATELQSPRSKFYYGRDSTVSWVVNKKRRPDYLVGYSISVTTDRVIIMLEGDPSPGINDFYRSFGYIGKIIPFNEYDHLGNFGVTVGMGDLDASKTGYVLTDISEENNPEFARWGEHTSNGMYSMSMLDTRSKVKFQAHYPAFLTQLPNYSDVGTIPSSMSKLILDRDGFQPSLWTGKYHASPVYMVHQAEGYRGYLDGVVAIHDHNLINGDELLVDTEILKDDLDPAKGTYTEVYKFYKLKSPVNMFKYSPAPDVITVAIIKEII